MSAPRHRPSTPPPRSIPPRRSQPPRDSTEEFDISVEQRAKVDALFDQLTQIGLYELVGAAATADTKTIKRSYNARVMEFHPDRFFRKRLGPYKAKLEAIMRRMTEAHDILCSAEHRARYDMALRSHRESLVDAMIAEAVEEMGEADLSDQRISFPPDLVRVPTVPPTAGTRSGTRPAMVVTEVDARRAAPSAKPPAPSAKPPAPTPARRPPAVRPSGPIENGIARLRELHERHKRRPLEGAERLLYDRLRDEVARIILAAQRLGLRDGETPRGALRVVCAIKAVLTMSDGAHQTVAVDISVGGLAAVVAAEPAPETRCEVTLEVDPAPIRARARVVNATPHGRDTFRISLAFDELDAATTAKVETLVLDLALGKLHV